MAKKKIKEISKPAPVIPVKKFRQVAKYVGDVEKYFPSFKKIINKGDLVPGMPLDEARGRRDFIVIDI